MLKKCNRLFSTSKSNNFYKMLDNQNIVRARALRLEAPILKGNMRNKGKLVEKKNMKMKNM